MFTKSEANEPRGTQFFYWAIIVASVGLFAVAALSPAPQETAAPAPIKVVQTAAPSSAIETVTVVGKRLPS